jgi:hypothetical protein
VDEKVRQESREKSKKEKKIMDELTFISKVQRIIKMRHDDVVAAMVSGGVDNMEKYQYMLGQIRTYQYLSQEISSLLEKKEQKEDGGKIVSIKGNNKDPLTR